MTLAVVRSIGAPRRLETAQEYEDFEQELVDQFLLAGLGAGLADSSIEDDRRAVFEFVRFLGRPVWTAGPEDADRFLTDLRRVKKLGHSTVQRKAWTLAQFFDFLIVRYQGDVHALTGHVLVQPIDEFNRPAKSEYGTPRIPPAGAEVDARRHGLEYCTAWGIDRALRILLSLQDTPGARFRATEVLLLPDVNLPAKPVLKLLAELDMLEDNRTPPVVAWFRERTAGLPEPMVGAATPRRAVPGLPWLAQDQPESGPMPYLRLRRRPPAPRSHRISAAAGSTTCGAMRPAVRSVARRASSGVDTQSVKTSSDVMAADRGTDALRGQDAPSRAKQALSRIFSGRLVQ
jgi:hypothetical protein